MGEYFTDPEIFLSKAEREKEPIILKATFFRHGRPSYKKEEYISGQMEGELGEEARADVVRAAKALIESIDREKEIVVIWASPKRRAQQTSQIVREELEKSGIQIVQDKSGQARKTSTITNLRDFETSGTVDSGSPFWDKLVVEEKSGRVMESGKTMGVGDWQEALVELSKEEGFEEMGAESPEDLKRRSVRTLTYLERVARRIKPPPGKTFRFLVFGHEETVTPYLEAVFAQGTRKGTGPGYAESVDISFGPTHESEGNRSVGLDSSFRGNKRKINFDIDKRKFLP